MTDAPAREMTALSLEVDGAVARLAVRPGESLLEVLRERLGVSSPKDGCSPSGQVVILSQPSLPSRDISAWHE